MFPTFRGIDAKAGLARLNLPWEDFVPLLVSFARSQKDVLNGLLEAGGQQDWPQVRLSAHSLAGAAGNVAAEDLRALAKSLEKAAEEGRADRAADLLARVADEFQRVVQSIGALGPPLDAGTAEPEEPDRADPVLLAQALRRLLDCLDDFDPIGVEEALDDITRAGVPPEAAAKMDRLRQMVGDLKYEDAGQAAAAVLNLLEAEMENGSGNRS